MNQIAILGAILALPMFVFGVGFWIIGSFYGLEEIGFAGAFVGLCLGAFFVYRIVSR